MANNPFVPEVAATTASPLNILKNHRPFTNSGTGLRVDLPNIDPSNSDSWNVRMTLPYGGQIHLWVSEFEADFSMGGTTAQSQYMRQYFPHNFMQPNITIRGTMPNQYQYNRLAGFIRTAHYQALTTDTLQFLTKSTQAYLKKHGVAPQPNPVKLRDSKDGGHAAVRLEFITRTHGVELRKGQRKVKGFHREWDLEGFVLNIASGSEAGNTAPDFEFSFIPISSSTGRNTGIYNDSLVRGSEIVDWMTAFRKSHYVTVDEQKQKAAELADAVANVLGALISSL